MRANHYRIFPVVVDLQSNLGSQWPAASSFQSSTKWRHQTQEDKETGSKSELSERAERCLRGNVCLGHVASVEAGKRKRFLYRERKAEEEK